MHKHQIWWYKGSEEELLELTIEQEFDRSLQNQIITCHTKIRNLDSFGYINQKIPASHIPVDNMVCFQICHSSCTMDNECEQLLEGLTTIICEMLKKGSTFHIFEHHEEASFLGSESSKELYNVWMPQSR